MQAPKEVRPAPDALRNGKPVPAAADAKPRGLEGDWRAAKEKGEGTRDDPRRMQDGPRNGAIRAVSSGSAQLLHSPLCCTAARASASLPVLSAIIRHATFCCRSSVDSDARVLRPSTCFVVNILTWCLCTCTDGRPEWMLGEEPSERMSKAERQRLDFEAERLRWQEERKKGGQTAHKAANVRHLSISKMLCSIP